MPSIAVLPISIWPTTTARRPAPPRRTLAAYSTPICRPGAMS
ncbi:hypothetical protein BLA29_015547 [Euroglyphus maynei]|uniref:Uncharacterized protein n=1 Tax=Euroglyphus maynei TaxID=6958 RepID=A0A1Y3BES7_EURMA|nr:hypothetical protein BLA29_015547 [Euroglyphus maynei]